MNTFKDRAAERVVLGGLLHEPDALFAALDAVEFRTDMFTVQLYIDVFQELHEMWVTFRPITLVSVWDRLNTPRVVDRRVVRVADEIAGRASEWLADLWFLGDWWPADIANWWPEGYDDAPIWVGLAVTAAAKLKWLASRRHAVYRAQQIMAEAEAGTDGPDYFNDQL